MKKYFSMLFLCYHVVLCAQDDEQLFRNIIATDTATVNTLFSYPDSIRKSIFLSSSYPQGFVRISQAQKYSSSAFEKVLSKYDDKTRKNAWEVSRYPELITLLAENGKKSDTKIKDVMENYPEKTKSNALFLVNEDYDLIVKINNLQKKFNDDIGEIVKEYPVDVQRAYRHVIGYPEIVTSLTQSMKTTVAIGDLYKRNPDFLIQKSDSINSEIAKQKTKESDDWKQNVSSDTSAMNQLNTSSGEFKKDRGGDEEKFDQNEYNLIVTYRYAPYPYWFGYPGWCGFSCWYPYPWWYHCGFYYGQGGAMILMGPPDYYFGYWYFHYPSHHYYYPHLSNHFYHHYENHHRSYSGLNRSVREWDSKNKDISRDWLKNDSKRPDRFKEYGQMEMNRQQYNIENPKAKVTRSEYLNKNATKYSDIKPAAKPIQRSDQPIINQPMKPKVKPFVPPRQTTPVTPRPIKPMVQPPVKQPARPQIKPGSPSPPKGKTPRK